MSDVLDLRTAFGLAVKARRKELGLNQSDVARACGIDTSVISKIETGKMATDVERAEQLALALDLGLEDLMRRSKVRRHPAAPPGAA